MPKLTIDDQEVEVAPGTLIIQACEELGIEIPRFCYHERLAVAGNCRMCLVEVSPGPPKPQASCALPCSEGMVVKTKSPMVKKAREGVMEFLLINHPLDCPICDQGGECDLQDQAVAYGSGSSRYEEHKRAVEDKYMGPLIKTHMTRCIHCTRCIRFATQVAGVQELGAFGRGEHMEVGTYVEQAVTSELSGNMIDICPVGALTSKPYAFAARPWELKHTETIDVLDAVGSNIRVDSRGEAVLRIVPRINEAINEEWISDKTRFACDGLRVQRLDQPYIRGEDGKLNAASWDDAFAVIAEKIAAVKPKEIGALVGNQACAESIFALKSLLDNLGVDSRDCRQEGAYYGTEQRSDYIFNSTIEGVEKADVILLIGANPRAEAAMLNARIRKASLNNSPKVYVIGAQEDLTYDYEYLGNDPATLDELAKGKHAISKILKDASNPMLVLGTAALAREDGPDVFAAAKTIAHTHDMITKDWNGFNVLHHAASRVAALDLGFLPQKDGKDIKGIFEGCQSGDIKLAYLLGVDEIDMGLLGEAFVVYQGHHGDDGAHRADVILPGATYTEKEATYVNMEGRAQRSKRAVFAPGQAKEDWTILRALSDVLGKTLPFNSLPELRKHMHEAAPQLERINEVAASDAMSKAQKYTLSADPFDRFISNFYMTDPISRASQTMAKCTQEKTGKETKKVAA